MRTTLTLDPDVAADLKRRARKTGKPFRQVLNDAARAGLRAQDAPPPRPYRLKPYQWVARCRASILIRRSSLPATSRTSRSRGSSRCGSDSRWRRRPQTLEQALGFIEEWLAQPYVSLIAPGDHHWPILRNLLKTTGTAGNLVADAHLAALAIEHGCAIYSADNDFKRFPGVEHVNPLA